MTAQTVFAAALDQLDPRVHAIGPAQWDEATPCSDWDVRALLNHCVSELVWITPLLAGETIADVGDRFEGDLLGDTPKGAWNDAASAARAAVEAPGALERTVELSMGQRPAADYIAEVAADLIVHTWDLARGIGADEHLEPDLVAHAAAVFTPVLEAWRTAGMFAEAVPVSDDADEQTRLLALLGRQP